MAIKTVNIVKGSDVTITVTLTDKNTGDPLNLTGFTGATGYFDQQDSDTSLAASGSLISADCGKIQVPLSEAQTALLEAGEEMDMEFEVQKGTETIIAQVLGKLTVADRLF